VACKDSLECDKWEWLDLIASEYGPPDRSTRLVLFVLSLHMTQKGQSCFPSQELIAKRSGLSVRAVRDHLNRAEQGSWIGIYSKRRKGQAWFVHEYVASIPSHLAGLLKEKPWVADPLYRRPMESASSPDTRQDLPPVEQHAANGAGRPANNAERPANGAATPGNLRTDTRQDLPTNFPSNSSENSLRNTFKERAAHAGVIEISSEEKQRRAEEQAKRAAEEQAEQAAAKAKREAEATTQRVLKAIELLPDYTDVEIAKVALSSVQEVEQLRLQCTSGNNNDAASSDLDHVHHTV
jgi:hypothetical protein